MSNNWQDILKTIFEVHEQNSKSPLDHEQSELYIYMAKSIAALKEDGWVDVNDRLPENNDNVLIFANKIGEQIEVAFYNDTDKEWQGLNDFWLPNITHWQPLPQPPTRK